MVEKAIANYCRSSQKSPNGMALLRAVSADLAKLPGEDDEDTNIPDVQAACETFLKWFSASAVPWEGPAPFTLEGLVDIAEVSCRQRQDYATANKALSLFFMREPPRNQVRKLLVEARQRVFVSVA